MLINEEHVITAKWNKSKNCAVYEYYKCCNYRCYLKNERVKVYSDKIIVCDCIRGMSCKRTEEEETHHMQILRIETNITEENYLSLEQVKTHVKSSLFQVEEVFVISEYHTRIPLKGLVKNLIFYQ